MNYLLVETKQDIPWSLAFHYQIQVLKESGYKVYIKYSHKDFIKFDSPSVPTDCVVISNEGVEEDVLSAEFGKMLFDFTLKNFSIRLPDSVCTEAFSIAKLATALVWRVLPQDLIKYGYSYPENFNRSKYEYNGIYETEVGKQAVTAFLEGMGVQPNLINLKDIENPVEVITAKKFDAIQIENIDDPYIVLLSSVYRGFDNMRQNPPVLLHMKPGHYNPRTTPTFGSQIFYEEKLDYKTRMLEVGKAWKIREACNHSFIKFLQMNAKK